MKSYFVFRTSVNSKNEVSSLAPFLNEMTEQWNFDLEDCDKILRVEEKDNIDGKTIEDLLKKRGFNCTELD